MVATASEGFETSSIPNTAPLEAYGIRRSSSEKALMRKQRGTDEVGMVAHSVINRKCQ